METTLTPVAARRPLPSAFTRLAWSNLAAQMAEQISLAAAPIVAVLSLGAGAGESGLLQTAQTLPFLLLAIPAGLLADRTSRQRLLVISEAIRMLSLLTILVLAESGALTLPLLALLGFIGTTGTVFYSVSAPSLIPAIVPRERLAAANGRIELVRSTAFVAGPALGGVLVGWIGGSVTFGLATALSAIAVFCLSGLREPRREPLAARHPLADLRAGGNFLFTHRLLRTIFLTAVFFNIGFFMLMGIFVAYAHRHLGLSAGEIGITLALDGAGMLVGALIAGRVLRWLPFGIVLLIGPFMGLTASLIMVSTIWINTPILAGLSMFTIGVGPTIWTISSVTLRQTVTPDAMLGRVSAVIMTATYGARPVGATIGAIVGSTISLPACVIAATFGFAIQAAIIATSAAARLTELPDPVDNVA